MGGTEQAFRFVGGGAVELMFDHVRSVIVEDHRESGVPPVENIEPVRFANSTA
jgi:hypothetical protein